MANSLSGATGIRSPTIFEDASVDTPSIVAAARACAAATASMSDVTSVDNGEAKVAAASCGLWRWSFSTPTTTANAHATSPSPDTLVAEADSKADASVDVSETDKKIGAAIGQIISLLAAGIENGNNWDLAQIKAEFLKIPQLLKQQYRHRKWTTSGSYHRDAADTIVKQINWFQMQAKQAPDTKDAYARVYARGLQIHFRRLLGRIVENYSNRRIGNRFLRSENESLKSRVWGFMNPPNETPFVARGYTPTAIMYRRLKQDLFKAAIELREENLLKLIDTLSVTDTGNTNIIELFMDNELDGQLFVRVIRHFCSLPSLTDKHFRILDLLIDAGCNFRRTEQEIEPSRDEDGESLYAYLLKRASNHSVCETRPVAATIVQLIQYLQQKGLDPDELTFTYSDSGDLSLQDSMESMRNKQPLSVPVMKALLEIGLDMKRNRYDTDLPVVSSLRDRNFLRERNKVEIARLMIGAGLMDAEISNPGSKEALLAKYCDGWVRNCIANTVQVRSNFIAERPLQPALVRTLLVTPLAADPAGIVADYAMVTDSDLAANVFCNQTPTPN